MTAWLSPAIDINVKGVIIRLQWHVYSYIYHLFSKQIFQFFHRQHSCFTCQQILSADFCHEQIFFLSADSKSIFLSSADLFFDSKCLCRHHGNDAHAGVFSFAPACCFLMEKFRLCPARIFASITIPFVLPDLLDILWCKTNYIG